MGHHKYQFSYVPRAPQSTLGRYIGDVIKRDPVMWALFLLSDLVHHIRYPIAFILVGNAVDVLNTVPQGVSMPAELWASVATIFVVLFVGESAHALESIFGVKWSARIRPQIRADLFNYTLGHSYQYLQDNFAGTLTRKITEASESIVRLNETIRYSTLDPILVMCASMVAMMVIQPLYGLVSLVFIVAIALPVIINLKPLHERVKRYSEARAKVTGHVVDSLTNVASVKNFARQRDEIERHNREAEPEIKGWIKLVRKMVQIAHLRRLTLVFYGAGMMWLCLYGWQTGLISVGDIAAIMGIAFSLTSACWSLGRGLMTTVDHLGYISDALRIISLPHQVRDHEALCDLNVSRARVEFRDVGFRFGDNRIFQSLNVQIEPGSHIGLIGPSGAGKSTFVHLLLRYFDPQSGQVLIDDQDIARVSQDDLRANISVIPQDTMLFHRSLMENIRYGRLGASDDEVREAAVKAQADEFITALPDGYDTLVGERGVKLSGGQRQRIAIARAILKDAPILILDEATSALDSESEHLIQESLKQVMDGKTVIAIAHRLSTIAHLDRLIVMDQGRIIEDGSHEDLLAAKGMYASLWAMQSDGFLGE